MLEFQLKSPLCTGIFTQDLIKHHRIECETLIYIKLGFVLYKYPYMWITTTAYWNSKICKSLRE